MKNIKKLVLALVVFLFPCSTISSSDLVEVNILGVSKKILQPVVTEKIIPITVLNKRVPIIVDGKLDINKLYVPVAYDSPEQYYRLLAVKKKLYPSLFIIF